MQKLDLNLPIGRYFSSSPWSLMLGLNLSKNEFHIHPAQSSLMSGSAEGQGTDRYQLYNFRVPIQLERKLDDHRSIGIGMVPALTSSLEAIGEKDFALDINASYRYKTGNWRMMAGGGYTHLFGEGKWMPMAGVNYEARSEDGWQLFLGFPFSRVSKITASGQEYFLSARPEGGKWHVHNQNSVSGQEGESDLSYSSFQVGAGGRFGLTSSINLTVEAGLQMRRHLILEQDDGDTSHLWFNNAAYLSLTIGPALPKKAGVE